MRYVDGTDLARLLRGRGAARRRRTAASMIAQVADALDAAHEAGHRPPRRQARQRPDRGRRRRLHAMLTDFGLMKNLRRHDADHAGRAASSARFDYAAPEQLNERRDRRPHRRLRARRRALPGAHAARSRTRARPPRRRCSPTSTRRRRACWRSCPTPRELLGEVVRRAMAKDPRDRFPSAGDLGRAALRAATDRWTSRRGAQRRRRRRRARSVLHASAPLPLPPALAVETGGGRVRRPRASSWTRSPPATPRPRPAQRQFVAALGRAGDRQDAAGHRARPPRPPRGRDRPLRPHGPGVARPLPAVHRRARPLRRPPRAARLPAELALELTELARFVPGAAQARAGAARRRSPRSRRCAATGSSRASRACSPSPPASARSCCCSTTCTGPTRSTTLLLGHLLQDAAPMRLLVLGTRAASEFEGELLARACAARARSSSIDADRADRGGDAGAGRPRRRHDAVRAAA